jgi:hypothetical protein
MEKLIILLKMILNESNSKIRLDIISKFQNEIWNKNERDKETDVDEGNGISEILSELAIDLDYYEPNTEWRKEDPSYYGDEKLEEEIRSALNKIDKLNDKS